MEDALAAMQAQMAQQAQAMQAMQALLDRTAAENQQLRETQLAHGAQTSQALSTLPMLIEQLMLAQSRPARERSLVDTRGIGKPQVFHDDECSFIVWRKKTEG